MQCPLSWAVIVLMAFIILFIVKYGRRFEDREGRRRGTVFKLKGIKLVVLLGGIFFILIFNGFYKGSLTKFFTKETPAYFESESDIVKAYPTWIYNIQLGLEVYIIDRSESGDKNFQRFVAMMEEDPKRFVYKSVDEGVKRMNSGPIAIMLQEKSLQKYYKLNPFEKRPKMLPKLGSDTIENLIFTYNSPLVPIFTVGSLKIMETGLSEVLENFWMGNEIEEEQREPLVKTIVTLGQTTIVFATLGLALILSIMILGLEIFWNWVTDADIIRI